MLHFQRWICHRFYVVSTHNFPLSDIWWAQRLVRVKSSLFRPRPQRRAQIWDGQIMPRHLRTSRRDFLHQMRESREERKYYLGIEKKIRLRKIIFTRGQERERKREREKYWKSSLRGFENWTSREANIEIMSRRVLINVKCKPRKQSGKTLCMSAFSKQCRNG